MSLLSRLTRLFAPSAEDADASPEAAERLAVAALLVHVARIDGTVSAAERERLVRLVGERFGQATGDASDLVEAAGELDYRSGGLDGLVDLLGHDADRDERVRLLALACEVAGSDGAVHEFEDGVLWRLGRALGLDARALDEARALARPAP